ncbi:MAG: NAD(P)H-binding protein [Halieaceae bacterium]
MNVLIAGATGYVGSALLRQALERGYHVTALVRKKNAPDQGQDHPRLRLHRADFTNPLWASGLPHHDAVISCIASRQGGVSDAWAVEYEANHQLLQWAQDVGVTRFILLSAICVQKPKLAFQRAKLAFEQELLASKGSLEPTVIRPTAFFKSLSGQISRVSRGKPFLVFDGGRNTACKPISTRDLGQFMLDRLEDSASYGEVLPIGGPGPAITPSEQGELLARLCGRKPAVRSISSRWFDGAEAILNTTAGISTWSRDKAEFARIAKYYATESMLVWDANRSCYDEAATPETGSDTLADFYQDVITRAASLDSSHHHLFGG